MVGIGCVWLTLTLTAQKPLKAADPHPVNDPIGVARGINPGRVVWVHDPNATDWEGPGMGDGYWWQSNNTDQAAVDKMMSKAIQALAGQLNEEAAWDAIFRYFNQSRGKENAGYQSGEKITIKVNMVVVGQVDGAGNQIAHLDWVNTSPQMILALLRQLVNVVGVAESDITVGDTTQFFPNHYWDHCHTEFPYVHYLANKGNLSRRGPVSSNGKDCEVPFYWSTSGASGKRQDYLPVSYAEATYLINFACLKGHSSGVTLCAKNHYGSFIRLPPAAGYYDLHLSLPNPGWSPGTGHYRAHVDITGHPHLGGKTLLNLIDGLYGGYYWEGMPFRWYMEPFGGDWPSSLFASQDPVAIDSVAYDFLLQEWPDVVTGGTGAPGSLEGGAEDYLHEAALAYNPPSGTFYDPNNDGVGLASLGVHEHWNNPVDKQYSRNLGTGDGIELVVPSFATVNGPIENVTNGKRYDYFRHAIDEANPGDQIVVSPGIYNEPINFNGKNLTISSTDPGDLAVVAVTVIEGSNQAVTFARGEDANCVLAGFTITGAVTGIYCSGASPTIANCCISANAGPGIRLSYSSNPTIANCNISGNAGCGIEMTRQTQGRYIFYNHATISNCVIAANGQDGILGGMPSITNCTIAANFHRGVSSLEPTITNSIVYLNGLGSDVVQIESDSATVTYTDVQGGWPGEGNIDADPYFVTTGFWNTNRTPENIDDDFWVEGDYRLQSQVGRWDPVSQTWLQDVVTSSCIDAGDPVTPFELEPSPNGSRINMGAYGGMAEASKSDYLWWFPTTQGPIFAESLGVVLPHEHIFTDLRDPTTPGYGQADPVDVVRVMAPLLEKARHKGVGLLFECSSIGVGRNVSIVAQVAEASGLPVVVPTGVYGRANFAPPEHQNMTEDELTTLFISEIRQGIEGTGIKAGFIKIATDNGPLTALLEKFLRAAGRAARETGAAIASHTTRGSNATRQADILRSISPTIRFIWVHAQSESNRNLHHQLAARGVFIEFDSLGWNPGQDSTLITAIKELLAAGHGDRILLSHDAGWYRPGEPNGGTQKPYTYLADNFIPKLKNAGVDDATIRMITETNPIRAFGFKSNE